MVPGPRRFGNYVDSSQGLLIVPMVFVPVYATPVMNLVFSGRSWCMHQLQARLTSSGHAGTALLQPAAWLVARPAIESHPVPGNIDHRC